PFDEMLTAGDQGLEASLGLAVTRPERLIRLQEQSVGEMSVECADNVPRIVDQHVVSRHQRAEDLSDLGLSDPWSPAKHKRCPQPLRRALEHVRKPSNDVAIVLLGATSDIRSKVVIEGWERISRLPGGGLHVPAAEQIVEPFRRALRRK